MAEMNPMPEQHVDGESIMPLLQETGGLKREAIFWHYPHYGNQGGTPGSSLRAGDYKLIEFYEDETFELYNLREDISETQNIASKMPQKTEELKQLLKNWKKEVNALLPAPLGAP
jgi:arylsulfatase A-like enzyme